MSNSSKIFLVGMPGSGKSTFGKKLAEKLNRNFFDLDVEIERMAGWVIPDIFAQVGENYFRELEQSVLLMLIKLNEPSVIATGGGAPCFFDNMDQMNKAGVSIFLDTPLDTIVERVKEAKSTRPLVNQMADGTIASDMQALYAKRLPHYKKASFTTNSNLEDIILFLEAL
ncbi:shikimate kinase [Reichenbachiella carrageenanivorans]|uniref:Shikimate kinase n=1 Tax=Reichenbachiella carrageenanivorans TaxID=2979869 RepID=A0ABY6D3E4_9BACT|nr:shikimate kinase [Reichenbachiella carrageenanivorans]UXX80672.1 shikimate kinase [Reichenbachiella carrageenanivorans]